MVYIIYVMSQPI